MTPTYILGIFAVHHDSAACLVRGGEIVNTAPEKGCNRNEHAPRLPADTDCDHLKQPALRRADLLPLAFYYALFCQRTLAGAPGV